MVFAVIWIASLFDIRHQSGFAPDRPPLGADGIIGPGSVSQSSLSTFDPLRLVVGRITGVGESTGTITEILEWGDKAYPIMLDAIENARRSIALSTFIFRDDEVGRQFIDALGRAHRRGVAVRVLIDGFGGGYFRSVAYHLLRRQDVPSAYRPCRRRGGSALFACLVCGKRALVSHLENEVGRSQWRAS